MAVKKKEFKKFTIMEHEKEQEYLREMHKHGWKFVLVTGIGNYHFEECEPEDVVYQLDYNQEGLAHKQEYVKMFEDCGWEYLQDFYGYSYFRKPAAQMKEDEGIFCDDASRLEMMQRVFKGRLIPLLVIFCVLIIPQMVMQFTNGRVVLGCVYVALLLVYLWIFISFAKRYGEYKKKSGK
ncbi:MAG: DUF2812 domain-containing protein [Lachnospiraceae bacterium]|nr:DUF2812 domain-containing protein [Lachnospiraceae bacterium]